MRKSPSEGECQKFKPLGSPEPLCPLGNTPGFLLLKLVRILCSVSLKEGYYHEVLS